MLFRSLGLRSTLAQLELIGGQPQPASPSFPAKANAELAAGPVGAQLGAPEAKASLAQGPTANDPATVPDSASGAWGTPPPSLPPLPAAAANAGLAQPIQRREPPALMVQGQGFGHGVGMSQWGAYGMALQGRSYGEILLHYYPGVELKPYRASAF